MAGAAQTSAQDTESLTLVTSTGASLTCTATLLTYHDTDNATQPKLAWGMTLSGAGCDERFIVALVATYKDSEGVTRTLFTGSTNDTPGGYVTGAYSSTSVRADVDFPNRDPAQSTSCVVTMTASPK